MAALKNASIGLYYVKVFASMLRHLAILAARLTTSTGVAAGWAMPFDRPHWWHDSNWWLVAAAVVTAGVISWQSWETRKSAEAARKIVELSAATNAQWLELEPHGLFTKAADDQPDPPVTVTIHPRWKIINNTPLPLRLKKVAVQIARGDGWETYLFEFDELIAPAKSDNSRSFFAPLTLDTEEAERFLKNGIEFPISISAVFVGASGIETQQHFGDLYFCKVGRMEINHPIGKHPTHQFFEEDATPSAMVREAGFRYLEPEEKVRG